MTAQEVAKSMMDKYGKEILLSGNKFCAMFSDMAPNFKLENKILRRMNQENILGEIYSILKSNENNFKKFDCLCENAGFSEEWKKIGLDIFGFLKMRKPL